MAVDLELIAIVEALLYATAEPVSAEQIVEILQGGSGEGLQEAETKNRLGVLASDKGDDRTAVDGAAVDVAAVHSACQQLRERLRLSGGGLQVLEVASGYRLGTLPRFDGWIRALRQAEKPSRLSLPVLETLAVIAYRQPVTVAEVAAIRGCDPSSSLRRLRDLGLVRLAGRKRTVGRPFTYATTTRFLEVFGLRDLEELPAPEEFRELMES